MNNLLFRIHIVTPSKIYERDITHIRLKDQTGYFGIMKGHGDFLTVLVPSLGYYTGLDNRETFLAVDGGIFSIRGGIVTLTSRGVFESDNAENLSETIDSAIAKREKSEICCYSMIEGIERSFMKKVIEFNRETL